MLKRYFYHFTPGRNALSFVMIVEIAVFQTNRLSERNCALELQSNPDSYFGFYYQDIKYA